MGNPLSDRGRLARKWLGSTGEAQAPSTPTAPNLEDILAKFPEAQAYLEANPGSSINIPASILPQGEEVTEPQVNPLVSRGRARKAGATLAKHRWKRLSEDSSKGLFPTMQADITYGGMTRPAPATPLTDFEEGRGGGSQYGANQGLLTGVNTPPTAKGTEVPYTKQDIRNPLGRAAANIIPSVGNLIAAPVQIAGGAAQDVASMAKPFGMQGQLMAHPTKTAEELAHYMMNIAKSGGKAAVWTLARTVNPGAAAAMEGAGFGPDQFVDLWAEDPVGVSLMLLGGVEGARRGVNKVAPMVDAMHGESPIPRVGDFDEGRVNLGDPTQIEGELAKARMKAGTEDVVLHEQALTENKARSRPERGNIDVEREFYARNADKLRAEAEAILAKKRVSVKDRVEAQALLDKLDQDYPQEASKMGLEPQPPRPGAELEPSRPVVDFRQRVLTPDSMLDPSKVTEHPIPTGAADLPPMVGRGQTTLQPGRVPKVAGIRQVDAGIRRQFIRLGILTKKGKPRKGGVTLGMGMGGAQDFLEKRGPGNARKLIKDIVEEMKKGGLTLNDAVDEINRQKASGAIDGPTESALLRETQNIYSKQLLGEAAPEGGTYSEAAQADMAKFLDEQQKLEAAREAGKPKYEDIAFKPAGVLNRPGKEPLRFFTADKDLPGPHPQKAGSKLNEEAIKAAGVVIPEGHKPFSGKLRVNEAPKEGFSFGPTKDPKGGTTLGSGLGGGQDFLTREVLGEKHKRPLKLFHGTPTAGFRKFDPSRIGQNMGNRGWYGVGQYFHTNPEAAQSYAWAKGTVGAIYPVHTTIKNPFVFKDSYRTPTGSDYLRLAELKGWTAKEQKLLAANAAQKHTFYASDNAAYGSISSDRLTEVLKENGHDGVIGIKDHNGEGHEVVIFDPKQIRSAIDKGTVLGSGLGGAQELFDNVSKIGLAHLQLGLTDFTSWAAAVRRDATSAGVHLTDDYLTKVWNSPEVMSANPRPPSHQAIAESIVNSNVQLSATKDVGPANTAAAQALLAPEVNTGPTSMQAMTASENVLGLIRDIWQSDIGTKSGVDTWARKYFPRFHEQATHFVTSGALAFLKARTHTAELRNIFSEGVGGRKAAKATTQRYLHDFSDLIIDDRARALDIRNAAELDALREELTTRHQEAINDGRLEDADIIQAEFDDLGPATHQMPRMDEAKRAKLLADPKVQAAIEYWHKKINPQIEQLTADLKIQKRLTGPLGLYVKFKQLDTAAAKRLQRTRPLGEAPATEHPTESRIGGVSAPAPWGLRPGFSGSSKRASGKLREGMTYENDLRYMLENTYKDRLLATTKNDLRQAVRDAAITTKRTNGLKPIPLKVFVGEPGKGPNAGRWEPVVGITLETRFGPIQDTYYVPESIARTYKHAMETPNNTNFRKAVDLASSAATAQVIIMPAEAIRHGFNAITAVVNSRFMYKYGPLAEITETLGAAATLGLSKMTTALIRAYKLEGPALSAAIEEYGSNGALRLSGYEGTHITPSLTLRLAEKVPGVRSLKDFVFGDPGSARGLRGMETRLRIVLGEAIKELQPELSNTEVAAKINDAYGTYVRKLEPQLTTLFKPFDPFARAGGGLTRSGYKLLTGRGVTGEYSPLIHSQVAGTLTAIAVYNFLLDDENKWPWEHKDYRAGDIMLLRRDDKTYRLSFADLANGLKRGAEFTGVTAVANALIRGERAPSVLAKEMIRGISNAYTNRLSPLIKGLNTLRTGKSMSESPSGDLYATAKPAMTSSKSSPMEQRFKAAGKGAIPVVPKLHELLKTSLNPIDPDNPHLQPSPEKLTPENYFAKVAYNLQDIFSAPYVPLIESGAKAERARGEVQNRIQQEWKDTTQSIAREAMNIPDENKRMTYIMAEIEERISDELITELGNPMPAKAASFKSIISLIYRAPAYHFRAETLQGINQTPQTGVPTPP